MRHTHTRTHLICLLQVDEIRALEVVCVQLLYQLEALRQLPAPFQRRGRWARHPKQYIHAPGGTTHIRHILGAPEYSDIYRM